MYSVAINVKLEGLQDCRVRSKSGELKDVVQEVNKTLSRLVRIVGNEVELQPECVNVTIKRKGAMNERS